MSRLFSPTIRNTEILVFGYFSVDWLSGKHLVFLLLLISETGGTINYAFVLYQNTHLTLFFGKKAKAGRQITHK